MEILDYAREIGAYISWTGSYDPRNTFVNAYFKQADGSSKKDAYLVKDRGWSFFGRSERSDFDEAVNQLAEQLSNQKFTFGQPHSRDCSKVYTAPKLVHTCGYRLKVSA